MPALDLYLWNLGDKTLYKKILVHLTAQAILG